MKKIIAYLLVLIIMIIIFLFSSQNANISGNLSEGFIAKIIMLFNHNISVYALEELIENLMLPVRKLAHFTIYFLLGLSNGNLLSLYHLSFKKLLIAGLLICSLYACTDEIHQLFVSGRAGSIIDVMIDSLGSFAALFIFIKISNHKKELLCD